MTPPPARGADPPGTGAVLARLRVLPHYAQVVVEADDATDLPVPETGDERAVASTEAVLVRTHGEQDGDVYIEVRHDGPVPVAGELVFDSELSFTVPRLVVGSQHSGVLAGVDLGRIGWIPVKIYVDPPELPDRVTVVLPLLTRRSCCRPALRVP